MTDLDKIKLFCSRFNSKIYYIFEYGSVVYGTVCELSDRDYVVIVDGIDARTYLQDNIDGIDIHVMTLTKFQGYLNKCNIMCMECFFNDPLFEADDAPDLTFDINLQTLRRAVSTKVNNSYDKARKKITLDFEDDRIGLKSLFHSLRIIDLGIQIARADEDSNVDLKRMSGVWRELVADFYLGEMTWDDLHKKYEPRYNALMTEFRKLAPKEL